jgi:hypothetical protein
MTWPPPPSPSVPSDETARQMMTQAAHRYHTDTQVHYLCVQAAQIVRAASPHPLKGKEYLAALRGAVAVLWLQEQDALRSEGYDAPAPSRHTERSTT